MKRFIRDALPGTLYLGRSWRARRGPHCLDYPTNFFIEVLGLRPLPEPRRRMATSWQELHAFGIPGLPITLVQRLHQEANARRIGRFAKRSK